MTKKQLYDIKKAIESNRAIIDALLSSCAKHLDDIAWIKGAMIKESLVLNPCHDQDIRYDTCSDFIQNIGDTWDTIVQRANVTNFSVSDVMEIHYNLAKNTDVIPCQMRTEMVCVLSTPVLTQNQEITRQKINDILYQMTNGEKEILQRAFDAHYEFIILQPFKDFNKRTARMLMNWFLISKGYRPIIFNYATDNRSYMNALHDAINGDKKSYYSYMYHCLERTQQMFINKLHSSR